MEKNLFLILQLMYLLKIQFSLALCTKYPVTWVSCLYVCFQIYHCFMILGLHLAARCRSG